MTNFSEKKRLKGYKEKYSFDLKLTPLPFRCRVRALRKIKTTIQEISTKNRTALWGGPPYDGFAIIGWALNGETPSVPGIGSLGAAYAISHSINDVETLHATSLLLPQSLLSNENSSIIQTTIPFDSASDPPESVYHPANPAFAPPHLAIFRPNQPILRGQSCRHAPSRHAERPDVLTNAPECGP